MPMLGDKVAAQTREILARDLRGPVRVGFWTQKGCHLCLHVKDLLGELAKLEPRLRVETHDFDDERAAAGAAGIHHVPAMALGREGDARSPVRYFGLPAGLEFGAFLKTLAVLTGWQAAPGVDAASVAGIARATNLKVFVLPDCPRCPAAVWLCASIAAASPLVTVEVIVTSAFPDLAERFTVGSTPKIVIDDRVEIVEQVTAADLLAKLVGA